MALSTATTARWTILSSSAGTPSGRSRPSAFGMYARRTGFARYAPRLQPSGEVLEVRLQILSVVPPRLPIDARRRVPLQGEVGGAQPLDGVDVVQERGEPLLPILVRCLTYPLKRAGRTVPALSPERVAPRASSPWSGPLPSTASAAGSSALVRRLPRYYGAVRLPASVHHRRASCGLPDAASGSIGSGDRRGISRFPCEVRSVHARGL